MVRWTKLRNAKDGFVCLMDLVALLSVSDNSPGSLCDSMEVPIIKQAFPTAPVAELTEPAG